MATSANEQTARREAWFQRTRERIYDVINPDGSGKVPQFNSPSREPIWILPALYSGSQEYIDLANRITVQTFDTTRVNENASREKVGKEFGIFQSNAIAHCLNRFGALLSNDARAVMEWHTEQVFGMYKGSAQIDYKFHGANDNMPMIATQGLILGGEALGNAEAVRRGVWNLNQFRRLLSRAAFPSEYNSSTYTAGTLAHVAMIASYSRDPEIRALATDIEHRVWADALLHFHAPTFRQAGPQSRAYAIDYAGHTHTLQLILWIVFGPEAAGHDPIRSYFEPDSREVIHFEGHHFQSIAEYCSFLDTDFHVPESLAPLIHSQHYPATLRARTESLGAFGGQNAVSHGDTYMEADFSLGTADIPFFGGEQSATLYATYKLKPDAKTFQDASSIFYKYLTSDTKIGDMSRSADGEFRGEKFLSSQAFCRAIQKNNVAALLSTPHLNNAPLETDTLKLSVIFPAHFGEIKRSIIGNAAARSGAAGESADVAPVSVEAGEVYVHIQPLLPTNLPRRAAVRFTRQNAYEVLEFVNYEGPTRTFTRDDLTAVLNGFVFTITSKGAYASLEEFHAKMSSSVITDYLWGHMRFFHFERADTEFEMVLSTDPVGLQTEAVDGRSVPRPVFESNQIDVNALPFMTGAVAPNLAYFPWGDDVTTGNYPDMRWIIGARGLPDEVPYSRRFEKMPKAK